jgi:hypothetical protein
LHNLVGKQSVTLDTFGGLVTMANPHDLPEGASPQNNDVDFILGTVRSRPPLLNVFQIASDIAGPNGGSSAVNTQTGVGEIAWTNPGGVLLDDGNYANVTLAGEGATSTDTEIPGSVVSLPDPPFWFPFTISGTVYTCNFSGFFGSIPTGFLKTTQFPFAIPEGSRILGIQVQFLAQVTNSTGTQVEAQLTLNGNIVGLGQSVFISGAAAQLYTLGGSNFLWDYDSWTPDVINGLSGLGVTLQGLINGSGTPGTLQISSIFVEVIYAPVSESQALDVTGFAFDIPQGNGIAGIEISVKGFAASGTAAISAQMLYNGQPVGLPKNDILLPSPLGTVSAGGLLDLWGITFPGDTATLTAYSIDVNNVVTFIANNDFVAGQVLNINGIPANEFPQVRDHDINESGVYSVLAATSTQFQIKTSWAPTTALTSLTAGTVSVAGSTSLIAKQVNNPTFGIRIIASNGDGVVNLDYVSISINQTPQQANFNYVKTFLASNGAVKTLALDASGTLWLEDVTNSPGVLNAILETVTPGSFSRSTTLFDREYLCFSDLTQGIDIPRQYTPQGWIDRVTQVGPGASPTFQATLSSGNTATITAFAISSNIVTFTAANGFTAGEVVTIQGLSTGTYLNGLSFNVLGTGLSSSQFEVAFVHANVSTTSDSGQAIPQYSYPIAASPNGITQPAAMSDPDQPGFFQQLLWSSGPGSTSAGNVITVYYANAYKHQTNTDPDLVNAFNSGQDVYVYIANAAFGNGTWKVTSVGMAVPPGAEYGRWYFTFNVPTSNYQYTGSDPDKTTGTYQRTVATLTTQLPVPGVEIGDQVALTGVGVSGWNATWPVVNTLNSGAFSITQSSLQNGIATYNWTLISGVAPAQGELVTITNTLNGDGILNVTDAVIASATGTTSGTFTVAGFPANQNFTSTAETGQATTAGTQFQIEPGITTLGTTNSPIFGNSGGGLLSVVGSSTQVIGAGTRQAVVIFLTRNGALTAPSPPVTFTTPENSNYVYAGNIPLGPPNVVARIIAFTEAGANGVPGANFYYIPQPVQYVLNGQNYQTSATVINDNTTTTAKFTFTDAVLLAATAIDVQGNNLFNQIELGSPAWNVAYAGRLFFGLCQNKVQNFNNLSFDGGYLPSTSNSITPLGWTVDQNYNPAAGTQGSSSSISSDGTDITITGTQGYVLGQNVYISGTGTALDNIVGTVISVGGTFKIKPIGTPPPVITGATGNFTPVQTVVTLQNSPIFGSSFYIRNMTAATQSILGMLTQSAFQDAYKVPILLPNTQYSVRVTCRCPSGATSGALVIDLTEGNTGSGYGATYGSFMVNLATMTTNMATFTGTLLVNAFTSVPSDLLLRLYASNIPYEGDVEIDRIEIFPTLQPINSTQVYGSYVDNPEGVDGVTGPMGLNEQNTQPVNGAAVMYDLLYFLKESSMYSSQDSPNDEPADWAVHEVSNRVGAIGPNAWDYGEEWLVTACRNGVFVFNGGQPAKIMQEIWQIWEAINWAYGNTIWLRNDIVNRKIYIGVPMAVPNQWIPNPRMPNTNPTQPNVILVCNYLGLDSMGALADSPQVHTTMFGTLNATDMRRKWSIWQIPSPYADFIQRGNQYGYVDQNSAPLVLGNGVASLRCYQFGPAPSGSYPAGLNPSFDIDLGAIPALYTTYGFTNTAKAQQNPLLGMHRKRYSYMQALLEGQTYSGNPMTVKMLANTLSADAAHTYTVPNGILLTAPSQEEYERPLNAVGQRVFAQFAVNQPVNGQANTGEAGWFSLSRLIMVGGADAWAPIRGIGQ